MKNKIFVVFCGLFLLLSSFRAQAVTVKATIDSSSIKIGDQARIELEVEKDLKSSVLFPILDSIATGLEIVEVAPKDTVQNGEDGFKIKQSIIVTAFDSALIYIPPFRFLVDGKDTVSTNALSLKVRPIEVDTVNSQIYDIKPIYSAPVDWMLILKIFIALLCTAILVFIGYKYYQKRKNQKVEIEEVVTIDSYAYAVDELEKIRVEKLCEQGKVKEYYIRITTVLRYYIKYRYDIETLEKTSDELLDLMRKKKCFEDKVAEEKLIQILSISDLVKFAKLVPSFVENDSILIQSMEFVELTKEKLEPKVVERK